MVVRDAEASSNRVRLAAPAIPLPVFVAGALNAGAQPAVPMPGTRATPDRKEGR